MKNSILLFILSLLSLAHGWGSSEKNRVRLQDVQVLTLHQGKMTTGRRSSPVPQLNCVGGSAKGLFNPQVVQCYNRGWDGIDVQWECKTDLDMDYRLGSINVVCEGYDYPDDPYILAGSCGLEYTLELTQAGRDRQRGQQNSGSSYYYQDSYADSYKDKYSENKWKGLSDLIIFGVVCIVIYAMYKTCIDTQSMGDRQYSSTGNDGHPGGAGGWAHPGTGYQGGADGYGGTGYPGGSSDSCGAGARQRGTGGGGGGFWTGAGVGGLLGYMFGARNNTGYGWGGYNRGAYNTGYGYGGGSRWGSSFGGGGTTFRRTTASAPSSSGTRTASGFGGTSRR